MFKPLHFYQVFNPFLNASESPFMTQAHEFYWNLKHNKLQGQDHLYWGKLGGCHLQITQMREVLNKNREQGFHTHLYLTDFFHFWVAKIEQVSDSPISLAKTLPFYSNKDVGVWFKLSDIDLISADSAESRFYLGQLQVDNHYYDFKVESLKPETEALNFPLIVADKNDEAYFQNGTRVLRDNNLIKHPSSASKLNAFSLRPEIFGRLNPELQNRFRQAEKDIHLSSKLKYNFETYCEVVESLLQYYFSTDLEELMNFSDPSLKKLQDQLHPVWLIRHGLRNLDSTELELIRRKLLGIGYQSQLNGLEKMYQRTLETPYLRSA